MLLGFKKASMLVVCLVFNAAEAKHVNARVSKITLTPTKDAIQQLQKSHEQTKSTFVIQQELDTLIAPDGGGACPSAVAIDALQILRVVGGNKPLENPHQAALGAFKAQPELLRGLGSSFRARWVKLAGGNDDRRFPSRGQTELELSRCRQGSPFSSVAAIRTTQTP
jgi:hypothetical protein